MVRLNVQFHTTSLPTVRRRHFGSEGVTRVGPASPARFGMADRGACATCERPAPRAARGRGRALDATRRCPGCRAGRLAVARQGKIGDVGSAPSRSAFGKCWATISSISCSRNAGTSAMIRIWPAWIASRNRWSRVRLGDADHRGGPRPESRAGQRQADDGAARDHEPAGGKTSARRGRSAHRPRAERDAALERMHDIAALQQRCFGQLIE